CHNHSDPVRVLIRFPYLHLDYSHVSRICNNNNPRQSTTFLPHKLTVDVLALLEVPKNNKKIPSFVTSLMHRFISAFDLVSNTHSHYSIHLLIYVFYYEGLRFRIGNSITTLGHFLLHNTSGLC